MSLGVSRISDKIPPAESRFNIKKCCEYLRGKILISDLDEGKGFYIHLTCEERKYTWLRKNHFNPIGTLSKISSFIGCFTNPFIHSSFNDSVLRAYYVLDTVPASSSMISLEIVPLSGGERQKLLIL